MGCVYTCWCVFQFKGRPPTVHSSSVSPVSNKALWESSEVTHFWFVAHLYTGKTPWSRVLQYQGFVIVIVLAHIFFTCCLILFPEWPPPSCTGLHIGAAQSLSSLRCVLCPYSSFEWVYLEAAVVVKHHHKYYETMWSVKHGHGFSRCCRSWRCVHLLPHKMHVTRPFTSISEFESLALPVFVSPSLTWWHLSPFSHPFIHFLTLSSSSVRQTEGARETERTSEIDVGPAHTETGSWLNGSDRSGTEHLLWQTAGPLWMEIISKLLQKADACQEMLSVKVIVLLCCYCCSRSLFCAVTLSSSLNSFIFYFSQFLYKCVFVISHYTLRLFFM